MERLVSEDEMSVQNAGYIWARVPRKDTKVDRIDKSEDKEERKAEKRTHHYFDRPCSCTYS